jgi:nucleoside-diphosphate-sugar epimerase
LKPYNYGFENDEKSLLIPAVQGVRSIMEASVDTQVKRVILTSSFGSVLDMGREESLPWTYTPDEWNPITYQEATDPNSSPQYAYRGSKTIAEKVAWKFVEEKKPRFDLVTLCPSMIFGPLANSPLSMADLNDSNEILLNVTTCGRSQPLPPCRFNFWIDVRDLAEIHV